MKICFRILLLVLIMFFLIMPFAFSQAKPVITVLDFNANNISEGDMSSIVSFLSSSIYDLDLFDVIDSSQRDAILSELNFSNSGCSDESCQLEIGKLLSAEFIVVGDIGKVGERYLIATKLLETETSRTVGNAKGLYGDINELLDSLHILAKDLGDKYLGVNGTDSAAEKTPLEVAEQEDVSSGSDDAKIGEERNLVTPIAFISSAVFGTAALGSYVFSSIKYQEYPDIADVYEAEALHEQIELFDSIAIYTAGAAAAGLITGFISWLFF